MVDLDEDGDSSRLVVERCFSIGSSFSLFLFQTKHKQQRIDLFVGFALSEDGRLEFIAFLLGTLMATQLESRMRG